MKNGSTVSPWSRDFTLFTVGTVLGSAGAIASTFALDFLVYDETGSTLAAALLIALNLLPYFTVQLVIAPLMDRLPRKPFLVGGDVANAVLYGLAGAYLLHHEFSYPLYLGFSLLLGCLNTFDMLAYNSLLPMIIPKGSEHKAYAVSSMIYPMLQIVMSPLAAVLYERVGVGWMLLFQAGCSLGAALTECSIHPQEHPRTDAPLFNFHTWWQDMCETFGYLRSEPGLLNIIFFAGANNGLSNGLVPILIAFFRTAPGFSIAMYSFFSVVMFAGQSLGSFFHYHIKIPVQKRYAFTVAVNLFYPVMDMLLLWFPYPVMLVNRTAVGFLGVNSYTLRQEAIQSYIPEQQRARLNAFQDVAFSAMASLFSLLMGTLGEVLEYNVCYTVGGLIAFALCMFTIVRARKQVRPIYNYEPTAALE